MGVDVLLGLQWGDEGKGKIVDVYTKKYDIIARYQGGPNAGHTLEFEGRKHVLHTIPSGIFHENSLNVIGNGVVIDPITLKKEIDKLDGYRINFKERLLISKKAHLILPTHKFLDQSSELSKGKQKIGSTLKGIGPTYMDKIGRNGLRIGDLENKGWKKEYRNLVKKHKNLIAFNYPIEFDLESCENDFFDAITFLIDNTTFIDSEFYLNNAIKSGKAILAEGAQGTMLDLDFGTYPFVTSSNTTVSGVCNGLGIPPVNISKVIGIFKAYTTRVGSGPFPTELFDDTGQKMGRVGNEFGSTTGRERRCGWLDLVILKYAIALNGVSELIMMKGDVLSAFDTIKVCTAYNIKGKRLEHLPYQINGSELEPEYHELKGWQTDISHIRNYNDLPSACKQFIEFIESQVNVPIKLISVGPDRTEIMHK